MAVAKPKSGVTELTSTTGSGPLTLTGAVSGFRGFVSTDDGLSYPYAIYQEGVAFETGIGTYSHGSRQLSRTTILANINGTTVPLVLGSGTKEVSIVIPGERVGMVDVENDWAADQQFNGYRLYLDAAQTSWLDMASAGVFRLYIASTLVWQSSGGAGNVTLIGSDDTATQGPVLARRRDSATPAINDVLGVDLWQGKVSGGTTQDAARIRATWTAVTAGAHASTLGFSIASAGALQEILKLQPAIVGISTGTYFLTAGKTASSITAAGSEFAPDGSALIACFDGTTPLAIGKGAGDGNYIALYDNGVLNATVSNIGNTVTWGAFTANHYGDFEAGVDSEHDKFGTVLACTGTLLATTPDPFYELRPAVSGDRRVLGVHGGRQRTTIMGGEEHDLIVLFAVGNGWVRAAGPVAAGDLLWASAAPGVAERQPNQDQIGPWTVAKATADSADDGGERLVSCIYMAG